MHRGVRCVVMLGLKVRSHLEDVERLDTTHDCANKADEQSRTVDSKLELEELADVGKDTAAPEHRLHDGAEVVIKDDDVGSFLGHLGASDAHG